MEKLASYETKNDAHGLLRIPCFDSQLQSASKSARRDTFNRLYGIVNSSLIQTIVPGGLHDVVPDTVLGKASRCYIIEYDPLYNMAIHERGGISVAIVKAKSL